MSKPTIFQFVAKKAKELKRAFAANMKVTIIIRHPTDADGEILVSEDDIGLVIDLLQRRRLALIESQTGEPAGEDA